MIERPADDEYAPFYAGYVSRVPDVDIVAAMADQVRRVRDVASTVTPEREEYRYGAGKWSVRELFGHLIDAERVFGYRAFCISRGDKTPLPAFDENQYIAASGFHARSLPALVDEFTTAREANLQVFRRLDPDAWMCVGTANANPVSVRALAFIIVGHVSHHLNVLRERYGIG